MAGEEKGGGPFRLPVTEGRELDGSPEEADLYRREMGIHPRRQKKKKKIQGPHHRPGEKKGPLRSCARKGGLFRLRKEKIYSNKKSRGKKGKK